MADRPILFSAPMVRALLDGRKTQTRRVLKPAPFIDPMGNFCAPDRKGKIWNWGQHTDGRPCTRNYEKKHIRFVTGDRLWVRETFAVEPDGMGAVRVVYAAGGMDADLDFSGDAKRIAQADRLWTDPERNRPSIHMPRWASRLTLIVTDVRVQRLQEISDADAVAEGAPIDPEHRDTTQDGSSPPMVRIGCGRWQTVRAWYHDLWDSVTGPGAWEANPWVVAVSFEVHRYNIDQMGAA